jgi:hypothetical protein
LTTPRAVHILEKIMLHRLIALFFILALAGQVLAGVCVCLDEKSGGDSKMSCCLRKKAHQPSMKKKSCCDSPCGQTGETLPGSHSESSVKIPIVVRKAVEKLLISLTPRSDHAALPPVLKRTGNAALQNPSPPVLYLRNHAFLI